MQNVLIVGAGALGATVTSILLGEGLQTSVHLVDGDLVEVHNLKRLPIFFRQQDVGTFKTEVLKKNYPSIRISNYYFSDANANELLRTTNLVVDLADDLHLTRLLDKHCGTRKIPLLVAAVHRMQGMVYMLHNPKNARNFEQLFAGFVGSQQDQCDMNLVRRVTIINVAKQTCLRVQEYLNEFGINNAIDVYDGRDWTAFYPAEVTR